MVKIKDKIILIEANEKPNNLKLTSLQDEAKLLSSYFKIASLDKLLFNDVLQLVVSCIKSVSIPTW